MCHSSSDAAAEKRQTPRYFSAWAEHKTAPQFKQGLLLCDLPLATLSDMRKWHKVSQANKHLKSPPVQLPTLGTLYKHQLMCWQLLATWCLYCSLEYPQIMFLKRLVRSSKETMTNPLQIIGLYPSCLSILCFFGHFGLGNICLHAIQMRPQWHCWLSCWLMRFQVIVFVLGLFNIHTCKWLRNIFKTCFFFFNFYVIWFFFLLAILREA